MVQTVLVVFTGSLKQFAFVSGVKLLRRGLLTGITNRRTKIVIKMSLVLSCD